MSAANVVQLRRERLSDIQDDLYQQALEQFKEDTRAAFAGAYRGQMTMVDWVQRSPLFIRPQTTREAFYEEMEFLGPQLALWKVLQESTCPLVAQLKKAVEDSYIERWAADVAELRSGE